MLMSSSSDNAVIPYMRASRSQSEKNIPSVLICVIGEPFLSVKTMLLPSSDSIAAHGVSKDEAVPLPFSKKNNPHMSVHKSTIDKKRNNNLF